MICVTGAASHTLLLPFSYAHGAVAQLVSYGYQAYPGASRKDLPTIDFSAELGGAFDRQTLVTQTSFSRAFLSNNPVPADFAATIDRASR